MSTILLSEPTLSESSSLVELAMPPCGTVYTETVVFSPPEIFAADAPYQIAIVDLDDGGRLTVRIGGDYVVIGDRVELVEYRGGIPFFHKIQ